MRAALGTRSHLQLPKHLGKSGLWASPSASLDSRALFPLLCCLCVLLLHRPPCSELSFQLRKLEPSPPSTPVRHSRSNPSPRTELCSLGTCRQQPLTLFPKRYHRCGVLWGVPPAAKLPSPVPAPCGCCCGRAQHPRAPILPYPWPRCSERRQLGAVRSSCQREVGDRNVDQACSCVSWFSRLLINLEVLLLNIYVTYKQIIKATQYEASHFFVN